ncbi:MAG: hypothetical protein KGI70_00235 [Patescibacteria group bacterium]|nr:hypothetical protein [Patescibacteria group bacterium]
MSTLDVGRSITERTITVGTFYRNWHWISALTAAGFAALIYALGPI